MPHAYAMLDLREQIDYEVNLEKGLYNSRLRIASFRSAATHLLPANIARFRNRFPHVEVSLAELDPAGVEQSLREGCTDVGLLPLPRSEEFNTVEIVRDEYVVLPPKGRGAAAQRFNLGRRCLPTRLFCSTMRSAQVLFAIIGSSVVSRLRWAT